MAESSPRFVQRWLLPMLALTSAALFVFWSFYTLDFFYTAEVGNGEVSSPLGRYLRFDSRSIGDAISSLAGVIAAIFGIVITVVSIIVQLAANRFTGVTRMFLSDKINLAVMTYYIIVCVCGVWLAPSLQSDYVPRAALLLMLVLSTLGLVLMAPYFGYVFWFLDPMNIISRTRRRAVSAVEQGATERHEDRRFAAQARVLSSMEELTDITSNSISGKDKIIASGAVDALKDFALAYIESKSAAVESWFRVGPQIAGNPDFVAMDPESLKDLEGRRTWVEWKVMRQYLGIYNEALAGMRDINYLIAIDTRYIGQAALRSEDRQLIQLVFCFMNSYLRATLNARDVRTAYNVLNQYRLLVEATLRSGQLEVALQGVKYMKYYGHVSYDQKLTFVTETVAYDVSALCEVANELGLESEAEMLKEFLDLDQPLLTRGQEKGLLGVRKAQVKLACYYLASGQEQRARTIARDMAAEPAERLQSIRASLESVTSKDFWEVIDRGRNFEFMPEVQRSQLPQFFQWLAPQPEAQQI
ncbi:MAG: hypothetical protein RJA70_3389 [Pseudomonadota bacterium]|jgi:hypothetical protein